MTTPAALRELADRLSKRAKRAKFESGGTVPASYLIAIAKELRTAATDGTAPSKGEWSALHCLWQAMVDAGGAAVVARHGAGNLSDRWTVDVTAGMLAIERHFYPERFGGIEKPISSGTAASEGGEERDGCDDSVVGMQTNIAIVRNVLNGKRYGEDENASREMALELLEWIGQHAIAAEMTPTSTAASEGVKCYVATSKESCDEGPKYWVTIERDGKTITPYHTFIRGRAEYAVAEWDHLLNGAPKPDILAYDTDEPTADNTHPPEVARDAGRYRYLRQHCVRHWVSDMEDDKGAPSLDICFEAEGHDLDAAVDIACGGLRGSSERSFTGGFEQRAIDEREGESDDYIRGHYDGRKLGREESFLTTTPPQAAISGAAGEKDHG